MTTLVTVGFGDIGPTNDMERLLMVVILVTGVAVFSILTTNFLDSVKAFRKISAENESSEGLSKFLNLLTMYNRGPLKPDMKETIEEHFKYFWKNDRIASFVEEEDLRFFDELD